MKSLYLVDISSFIFRAYYAIRPLSAPDGTPVNAVYGVVSMLQKLIQSKKPDHLIICKDRPDKGFRHEVYPDYKANREVPPEDLVPQFDLIQEFVSSYPMVSVDCKGYEADDIIATLAERYRKDKDMQIYIVSSDKDLMQLVGENVCLYDTMKDKISKEKEVVEKFGVGPELVVDVQSLCGDATDNIPGIAGVGPKTAAKLINEYGDLESVFSHAGDVKGKLGEKLRAGIEDARVSKKLVTLVRDVALDLDWNGMALPDPDYQALSGFYEKLGFKKFLSEAANAATGTEDSLQQQNTKQSVVFECIDTVKKLQDLVAGIKKQNVKRLAFDTETTSLNTHETLLVGVSLCSEAQKAYYIPLGHKEGNCLEWSGVKKLLAEVLEDPKIPKVAQNAKFDLNVLHTHGISVNPIVDDTHIASYLCDPTGQHNLDALAEQYLGTSTLKYADVVPKKGTFADVSIEQATQYAAEDAWLVFRLMDVLAEELQENGLSTVYQNIEIPLIPILAKMERAGVLLNTALLGDLQQEFSDRLKDLEQKIYKLAGEEFNINSPKQLSVILFEKLGLPVIKKTKTGYSTDMSVLEVLSLQHELPERLVSFRMLSKLLSTYVVQLKELIDHKTGRIHTHFNQAIVATGRLSSTDPNLQNIPIKTAEGRRIREVFIAPAEHELLSADYSQVELRLLAAFSQDQQLIDAYTNEEDIHKRTASRILGLTADQIGARERTIGKTVNFGVIYGQSSFGLSKQLGVPVGEAKHFIDTFYKEFSRVSSFKEEILEHARTKGYVTTHLGRRRYLSDINSKNKINRSNAERVAFNTVFQGSAADLIKKAMVDLEQELTKHQLTSRLLLQVHDELIFEVPKAEIVPMTELVPRVMSQAFELDVPLTVSCHTGQNWAEAH